MFIKTQRAMNKITIKTKLLKKLLTMLLTMLWCLFTGLLNEPLFAVDGETLLQRMDEVMFAADDQYSEINMTLIDEDGSERVREANVWQKGTEHRLFRFTAPADVDGIAFLSLPDDVMYMYMPAYGRERRIASHVKTQSFAGTDFTYEDLEAGNFAERYAAELLEETEDHYILELEPLPDRTSDYSRIIVHLNKDHYYPEEMEFFDRGGQEYKMADYTFERKEEYWYSKEIRMTDVQRNHTTRMIFDEVEFDTGLEDLIFTVRNLTR